MANFPTSNLPQTAPTTLPGGALLPLTYTPLPLGSIQPTSWLKSELSLSAAGLAGHEYDFYPYVSSSSWLGHDQEYSELNEGLPYWFNGLVPLAYTLDDARLKAQVHAVADYVLAQQQPDGWLGPEPPGSRTFWGRYPLLLGLTNLADANHSWEAPVVDALHRFNGLMNGMLSANYSGYIYHADQSVSADDFQWGRVRAQDMMISLMWLLERHPRNAGARIVQNLFFLHQGAIRWEDYWVEGTYIKENLYDLLKSVTDDMYPYLHGVNVAQGLKAAGVVRRFTHNQTLAATSKTGNIWTYRYHGQTSGNIIADERSDGLEPYAGAELCSAVEAIYSHAYSYTALGDGLYADHAELAAFNALPASLTPDWWAHQYMAQLNQPVAANLSASPFYNVNSLGNSFGLEPNYPCCTVNHAQGLPKFAMHAYLRHGANGLLHALLAPATATATLASGAVRVACDTAYPFGDVLAYTIDADAPFDFYLRQPGWAPRAAIAGAAATYDSSTQLHHIYIPAGRSTLRYTLAPAIRTTPRANDTVAVHRGALLYALDLAGTNTSRPAASFDTQQPLAYALPAPARDYAYANSTPWNVAIDPASLRWQPDDRPLASPLFAAGAPPGWIGARACEIEWPLWRGVVPGGPVVRPRVCVGPVREVRLVPYASAKVHMAELPVISL